MSINRIDKKIMEHHIIEYYLPRRENDLNYKH